MLNNKALSLFTTIPNSKITIPLYNRYSFSQIVPTILNLLLGENSENILSADCFGGKYPKPKRIVLFLLDAFGFKSFEKHSKDLKILKRVTSKGTVTPISSIFPSTTAAAISTINSGVLPSSHGVFEWFQFSKEVGQTIATLPFSTLEDTKRDSLLDLGFTPKILINTGETVFSKLRKNDVRPFIITDRTLASSAYNNVATEGAEKIEYGTPAEGLANLKESLENYTEKSFYYFYTAKMDSAGHRFGVNSKQFSAEVANFWLTFEYVFSDFKKDKETLFLFTADHGLIDIPKENTYFLNRNIPEIKRFLKTNKNNEIIYPMGSPRDVFLHIKEAGLTRLYKILRKELKGKADVLFVNEAIKLGLFGGDVFSENIKSRLGQVLILPNETHTVWWDEPPKFGIHSIGHHGGISMPELLTFIAAY